MGLDIPPGLEDWYFDIMQFANGSTQEKVILKNNNPTRQRVSNWIGRSLFVKWKELYSGYDSARRARWDLYWGTLPFGSHGGANGYPGSGYSAFVYVNAPRYRDGLDLLDEPPTGAGGLLLNYDFSQGDDNWVNNTGYAYVSNGNLVVPAQYYYGEIFYQNIGPVFEWTTYDVAFDVNVPLHGYCGVGSPTVQVHIRAGDVGDEEVLDLEQYAGQGWVRVSFQKLFRQSVPDPNFFTLVFYTILTESPLLFDNFYFNPVP